MWAARCALLAALVAACGATATVRDCPALEVPNNVLAKLPGASVNLTCPRNGSRDRRPVHWELHTEAPRRLSMAVLQRPTLVLHGLRPGDSGNYSCFRANHPAGILRLLVEEAPPEEPQISCFRRNPFNKVTCEWRPRASPSPATKARLLVKNFPQEGGFRPSQQPCLYSPPLQAFSCQLPVPEADNSRYTATLCLANTAGSRSSRPLSFWGYEVLQPDPPANITVTAVDGNPRWLRVSWRDPPSWNTNFYRLQFELRYRAERSKAFTTWKVQEAGHSCIIRDAWSRLSHVVQMRAQEEFGMGQWSPWSPEVRGTPWTEPRTSEETSAPQSVQALKTEPDEDVILPVDPVNTTSLPVQDASAPLPAFLVAGGSLVFGALLCIGIVLRFKKTWKRKSQKESKTSAQPPYSPGHHIPEAPPVLVPLISPVGPPSSFGPDGVSGHGLLEAGPSHGPYDVINRDYFFPR
ncbi:interleukin-6 receptor subunit alpha isoform X1 [Sorex araneus]|uniref:interleukin-6 receptor subunit alpha isoform X1 n=2 Tax=Sorex araneus TaxID=42254 RepID=UPI0024337409|nr:interleukin-6 receptor subunit alpha isoform X1 [Sorex araneus]